MSNIAVYLMLTRLDSEVDMTTTIVPVSDLRRNTSRLLRQAGEGDEPVYITQHGRPKAVLLSYEAYERLMAHLEDLADLAVLRERADEPARPFAEFLQEINEE
jgi:prevent-host-death family protein